MPVLIFCDLDDSLWTSGRTCPEPDAVPVAWYQDKKTGEMVVSGWLTSKQREFFTLLTDMGEVIPTTARSSAALRYVALPLQTGYSIVSFGGVILTQDGTPEPAWHELMQAASRQYSNCLTELLKLVQDSAQAAGIDARCRIVNDHGLSLYLTVKHNQHKLTELSHLHNVLSNAVNTLPGDWTIHCNGSNLAALPPYLGKEHAVRWIKNNIATAGTVTVGIGDSHSDVNFMGICDYLMLPSRSQNHKLLQRAVRTTS